MRHLFRITLLVCLLLLQGLVSAAEPGAGRNKVLLIGIDGTRPDALAAADTPNLDRLRAGGAFSEEAVTGDISFSGPGWASMLTGVWCDKHGVLSNEFLNPHFDEYPSLFDRVHGEQPEKHTVSIAHWDKINAEIIGYADVQITTETDEEVARLATQQLTQGSPDLMFLHFDDVDHAGHDCCFSPGDADYIAALETVDDQVGVVLDALATRRAENWLVLVSTDHGGGGFIPDQHGANVPDDRRIFILAAQQRSAADDGQVLLQGRQPQIVDIAVTIYDWLGLTIDPAWKLDGQVLPLQGGAQSDYEDRSIPQCALPEQGWDAGKDALPLPGGKAVWEENPI